MNNENIRNNRTEQSHSIFIGDKIERAVEIIGAESDDTTAWELSFAYADDEIQPDVELRGNYLYISVDMEDAVDMEDGE
jgi:hypothetical protein